MLRLAFTWRWLPRHLLLLIAVAVLAVLGRWQWDRGLSGGDLRNTFYGLQWWVFGAVAVFAWIKSMHTEAKHGRAVPVDASGTVAGTVAGAGTAGDAGLKDREIYDDPRLSTDDVIDRDEAEDDDVAAYNRYLEQLAARYDAHEDVRR